VLDGVLQQQTYLTAPAERTRTKLLEAVAAGKELHGVRPHKLGLSYENLVLNFTRVVLNYTPVSTKFYPGITKFYWGNSTFLT
jgi:hypothetical protein